MNWFSIHKEEIIEIFSSAPRNISIHAFGELENIRKQSAYNLLDAENQPESVRHKIRERFGCFIPLLGGLIELEEQKNPDEARRYIHSYYASLAYLYKDKNHPDWEEALYNIKEAIKIHNSSYGQEKIPAIYVFNKLICSINSKSTSTDEEMSCLDETLNEGGDAIDMLLRARPVLAPRLHEWLASQGREKILNDRQHLSITDIQKFKAIFEE